jgi:hypothetical protein
MRSSSVLLCIAALFTACKGGSSSPAERRVESQLTLTDRVDAPARDEKEASGAALLKAAAPAPSEATQAQMPSAHSVSDSVIAAMIIRTGQASVEVDSLDRGIRAVRMLAGHVGGYVANSSISAGTDQVHSATLEIKLPSPRFDEAINGLQPIGHLETVSVSAEDVGEEYVDVAARVTNAHKLEQRLIDILGTRTGKLKDVLDVERELARVREDIERQEGRMRYLRARSSMSTLAVTVHEKLPVVAGMGSWGVLAEAFRQAWRNFIDFTARAIAAMGTLLPLAAIVGVIGWLVWRSRRARRPASDAG